MAESTQARVQDAVTEIINDIDKSYLRKLQQSMHLCAAECCEDNHSSIDQVHHCIERCSKSVSKAQNYIQGEISNFQDRLQRCVLQCQDQIRDKMSPKTTEKDIDRYRTEFEGCVSVCGDNHIALLPAMLKRMKETLKQQNSL